MTLIGTWNLENLLPGDVAAGPVTDAAYRGKPATLAAQID